MIAGPNGSGKSTLTRWLKSQGIDLGEYINPDEIAATLTNPDPFERSREAQAIADAKRTDCVQRRVSFSFETVMSHASKIELLKQCRAAGYLVVINFVGTESPDINVARVAQRVALKGHGVPKERIIDRYARTMALLPSALAECDRGVLFDNSFRSHAGQPVVMRSVCEVTRKGARLRFHRDGRALTEADYAAMPAWARRIVQAPVDIRRGGGPRRRTPQ
jgi:predicted ABC-type ATPase